MDVPNIPGYQIEAEIGKGGMGVVYRARHLALDRVVALKVIDPRFSADPEFVRSFATEARIVAKLSHPNIVSVYDFGSHEGTYYLSMEYVPGRTLQDLLTHRLPSLDELVSIVSQVAAALDYAHREQVVHRDVKTGNILLCPDGKAMVIDFGVAHGTYSTAANSVWLGAGTRSYMSPEQCRGFPASPRSDQYSLAVAVFEMLMGRLPFEATDPVEVMQQHIHEAPPSLCRGRTDITPRLEAAVLRAMSKVPEMRFQSVGAFDRELEAACKQAQTIEPLAAPAPVATAVSARMGAVSLVDGISAPPQTPIRVANGWVYAVRGGEAGRARPRYWLWALSLMLLCGLGAAGVLVYSRITSPPAIKKPAASASSKAKSRAQADRTGRRTSRTSRRSSPAGNPFKGEATRGVTPPAHSGTAAEDATSMASDAGEHSADGKPSPAPDEEDKAVPADKSHDDNGGTTE